VAVPLLQTRIVLSVFLLPVWTCRFLPLWANRKIFMGTDWYCPTVKCCNPCLLQLAIKWRGCHRKHCHHWDLFSKHLCVIYDDCISWTDINICIVLEMAFFFMKNAKSRISLQTMMPSVWWTGDVMIRAFDLWLGVTGSTSGTLGKLFTHVPLSASSINWYQWKCSDASWLRR